MNYSVLHTLVKKINSYIRCLNNFRFDCIFCTNVFFKLKINVVFVQHLWNQWFVAVCVSEYCCLWLRERRPTSEWWRSGAQAGVARAPAPAPGLEDVTHPHTRAEGHHRPVTVHPRVTCPGIARPPAERHSSITARRHGTIDEGLIHRHTFSFSIL